MNAHDVQARLARERAEWQRQAELRHLERMRALQEEILASQKRYRENCAQAELRYQEKMKAVAEQLRMTREAERCAAEVDKPEGSYTLADEMLSDLRRRCPDWEVRRQKVMRVSDCIFLNTAIDANALLVGEQQEAARLKTEATTVSASP